jgi:hypothetical protein
MQNRFVGSTFAPPKLVVGLLALGAVLAFGSVWASDQPDQFVLGSKLLVKSNDGDASKNKLVFLSKDTSFDLPSPANDPTVDGAVLRVIDLGNTAGSLTITLIKERWKPMTTGYKYTGEAGDPCKKVLIKDDKLVKIVCKGTSVTLTPPFGAAAALSLQVGAASIRYCATFAGAAIAKNQTKAGKGLFKGKDAPPPAACLDCGDGNLDAGEQCDDGNNSNGDCCSATCQFEASGGGCTDGDACTVNDTCNGSGMCTGGSTCGDDIVQGACGEQCDGSDDGACENRCLPDCSCAVEPTCTGRTVFAGGPQTSACHTFDDNQALCEQAFHVGGAGVASCWYDVDSDGCNGCGPFNQSEGLCVNECNPPTCPGDPSRTAFAGGPESGACQNYGVLAGTANCNIAFHLGAGGVASCYYDADADECRGCGPSNQSDGNCVNTCAACTNDPARTLFVAEACDEFDGDQASCEQAFTRDECRDDVSCYYDSGQCSACDPDAQSDGLCRNTCADGPVTCTNDPSRTIDAGGPQSQACHQFDGDPVSCQQAFHRTDCNQPTSCFYDYGSEDCSGCGPNNEEDGACVNTCVAGPLTCPGDPSRTQFAGMPGSSGCQEFGVSAGTAACALAFNIGNGGVASCYTDGVDCFGCGPPNETQGQCINTCIHPLTCAGDPARTIFAGGPDAADCSQFDGNQASCESAFVVRSDGVIASCFYDSGDCSICWPFDEGDGDCDNTCRPDTCAGDATRTIYAGGPGNGACHFFDGNQTNCEKAYHKGASSIIASCFYDADDDECLGCGPHNQESGACSNTCALCTNDASRTIFAGGPFTTGCAQFDGDQASCESAFAYDELARSVSCFFDGVDCSECDADALGDFECRNTCDSGPPTCQRDATRTIFLGGPGNQACHALDGDPVSCNQAFHFGNDGFASCYYNNGECSGCGSSNQSSGNCLNTCVHGVAPCPEDATRTLFAGGPGTEACHQFDGNKPGCLSAYHLDQCRNATSCYYDDDDDECRGCGPNNQQDGACLNTCKTGPASCDLDPSRTLFGGGPGTGACGEFTDQASCLAAFHVGQCGVASCYWNGSCAGCGPNNFFEGECFNTCQAP